MPDRDPDRDLAVDKEFLDRKQDEWIQAGRSLATQEHIYEAVTTAFDLICEIIPDSWASAPNPLYYACVAVSIIASGIAYGFLAAAAIDYHSEDKEYEKATLGPSELL